MDWSTLLVSKQKKTLIHILSVFLLALALVLAPNPVTDSVANVTAALFYYPFYRLHTTLDKFTQTAQENKDLRAALVDLTTRLNFASEAIEENRRLRSLLGFSPPPRFRIVPAEIIGVYGEPIATTVLINKGAHDEVKVNQTIIDRNGLAGRVAEVMPDFSTVYLLTDQRCRVAARIKRSREQGIIRYQLERGMYLDNLPQKGDVMIGDTVITSGLGGIFPEGLVIGTIAAISTPEREFFYDLEVDPAVDFNGIDELYILFEEQ